MIDENEFFRKTTLKICGSLKIEEGLRDCIRYLSDFMPADNIYLESYEEDIGAMRYVARADKEKGELLNVLVPLSAEAKARAEANVRQVRENPDPFFMSNQSDENPIARDLLKALGHPPSSILGISLAISGQFVGAVLLIAAGSDRFNAHHAKLFATLKEPFFVAMSNALQHREVLKFKDLLADDNRFLQSELRRMSGDEIVGANFGLKPVMYQVQQVATLGSPVLILGETGTGKDVIANAIHYASARSEGPFVSVNCGAIPDSLIDSELFGHEKGAFTGALSQKRGRFERANKGTIFLDEIGELPPAAQVRLLRVLQNREIERVGGVKTISLDIRIIAATNRNLEEMVKDGLFREDLWFRLNVFPISIPPLRRRSGDIPALVRHLIERKAKELKLRDTPDLAAGSIQTLMAYDWPGNVRELENAIERALILHPEGPLQFEDLSGARRTNGEGQERPSLPGVLGLDKVIKRHIERVLEMTDGKIHGPGGAGELLEMNPNTLRSKMKNLGITFGKK